MQYHFNLKPQKLFFCFSPDIDGWLNHSKILITNKPLEISHGQEGKISLSMSFPSHPCSYAANFFGIHHRCLKTTAKVVLSAIATFTDYEWMDEPTTHTELRKVFICGCENFVPVSPYCSA